MMGSHRMWDTCRFTGRPSKSPIRTPSGVSIAKSPSARKNMSRVCGRMAGTSDATKYSLSPSPITTGGPKRAATILFGSVRAIATSAKTPASCFRSDGGHIRRHEILVVAQPDHHRRPEARGHDFVWIGARNRHQREDPGELLPGRAHRLFQIALEVLLHQVRDDLSVGLRFELVAFGLQLLFQGQVILDDAVVHHHDIAAAIAVRMRVFLGGAPVRGPARVPNAIRAVHGVQPDGFFQVAQLAGRAPHGELTVIAIYRQAGRVVAAVLQALQAFQDDRNRLAVADVADDAAYKFNYRCVGQASRPARVLQNPLLGVSCSPDTPETPQCGPTGRPPRRPGRFRIRAGGAVPPDSAPASRTYGCIPPTPCLR